MLLFIKAKIPGASAPDLFAETVHVSGFTNKEGRYVAPHMAIRHKRHEVPKAPETPVPDLFSHVANDDRPKPAKAKREPAGLEDDLFSRPAATPAPAEKPESTTSAAAPQEAEKPSVSREKTESAKPLQWGVPAGVSKKERKAFNAAAVALLESKTDEQMTPADKQVLARYSGTGGVGDSLNEFYTDPAVASAMWSMLENAGFHGGEVLEPSSGIGVFLHTAPERTRVTAVEIEPISARIAGILHGPQGHEVNNSSLERFATQDGRLFDAVIGNVPFGLRGSTVSDDKPDLATCERYFFDTALDKTKDNGLVAFIVPTGIMDSRNGRAFRENMLTKGEFLGAYRLPNTAFKASHTQVTSDIVMFRKRPQTIAGALGAISQDQLKAVGVWDDEFLAGTYFTEGRGAENIMGRMEEGWRAKAGIGDDITVVGDMQGVPEALAKVKPETYHPSSLDMGAILDAVGDDSKARQRVVSAALKPPYQVAKVGDTKVVDGVLYVLQGEPPRWHRAEGDTPEAVQDAIRIGTAIDDLARGHASPVTAKQNRHSPVCVTSPL